LINSINASTNDIQLEKEEKQLEMDREKLEQEKPTPKPVDHTDIFQLNVGGEIIITTRQTLMKIPESTLSILFNGQWKHKLPKDKNGNIFFDFNPILFRHLLDQLQIIETNNSIQLYPPSQPSLVEPFKKMIRKLGLQQSLSSEKKNVITFNVGGQKITNQRTTFMPVSNSTFDTIVPPTKMMESDVFVDYDPKLFQHLINQLRKNSFKKINSSGLSLHEERSFKRMLNDLSIHRKLNMIYINDVYRSFFISLNSSHSAYRRNRFFSKINIYSKFLIISKMQLYCFKDKLEFHM
jgi:hypothetical protein